ncbi:hypothetical protein MKEN_00205000 [Mycena kentingensis (nom. inval.)]|nr:hypothetical protein MKEN_00205000 [Mycena kentingensis (nom. inval.)]
MPWIVGTGGRSDDGTVDTRNYAERPQLAAMTSGLIIESDWCAVVSQLCRILHAHSFILPEYRIPHPSPPDASTEHPTVASVGPVSVPTPPQLRPALAYRCWSSRRLRWDIKARGMHWDGCEDSVRMMVHNPQATTPAQHAPQPQPQPPAAQISPGMAKLKNMSIQILQQGQYCPNDQDMQLLCRQIGTFTVDTIVHDSAGQPLAGDAENKYAKFLSSLFQQFLAVANGSYAKSRVAPKTAAQLRQELQMLLFEEGAVQATLPTTVPSINRLLSHLQGLGVARAKTSDGWGNMNHTTISGDGKNWNAPIGGGTNTHTSYGNQTQYYGVQPTAQRDAARH